MTSPHCPTAHATTTLAIDEASEQASSASTDLQADFEERTSRYAEAYDHQGAPVADSMSHLSNPAAHRNPEHASAATGLRTLAERPFQIASLGLTATGIASWIGLGVAQEVSAFEPSAGLVWTVWACALAWFPGAVASAGASHLAEKHINKYYPTARQVQIPRDAGKAYFDFQHAHKDLEGLGTSATTMSVVENQAVVMDRLVEQLVVLTESGDQHGALGVQVRDRVVAISSRVQALRDLERERAAAAAMLNPDTEVLLSEDLSALAQAALATMGETADVQRVLDGPARSALADH